MSKWYVLSILTAVMPGCGSQVVEAPCAPREAPAPVPPAAPRNLILMLADGAGPEAYTLARWVKGEQLCADGILTGAVRTYGADSLITDSAPGGTAYATGFKAVDKTIAVGASRVTIEAARPYVGTPNHPTATLLEAALDRGRAVGLVVTSELAHATPAAFSAHVEDRSALTDIAEQQSHLGLDVAFGGGYAQLVPAGTSGGARDDGEDLRAVLRQRGAELVTNQAGLLALTRTPAFGLFAPGPLSPELDRTRLPSEEPSLALMTERALQLLATSHKGRERGFFLFVEGSQIDWGGHQNEPVYVSSELLAFDRAICVARRFVATHPDTLLVIVSDHATGGMSIGLRSQPKYATTDDEPLLGTLRRAQSTSEGLVRHSQAVTTAEEMSQLIESLYGFVPTSAELASLMASLRDPGAQKGTIASILSERAGIGWTTGGHVGHDVFLFAEGPGSPRGLTENALLGRRLAELLGLDLAASTRARFVELTREPRLAAAGFTVRVDRREPKNPVGVVEGPRGRFELPVGKDLLLTGGRTERMPGVTILLGSTESLFAPEAAVLRMLGRPATSATSGN